MAFRLSAHARRDLDAILRYSLDDHGRHAAARYQLLLTTVMEEIGDQPLLPGSRWVEARPGVRAYAIFHSRLHVAREQRVRHPRHQVVYRVASDGVAEILGIVGDSYPAGRVAARK